MKNQYMRDISTLHYYESNSRTFVDGTLSADMQNVMSHFKKNFAFNNVIESAGNQSEKSDRTDGVFCYYENDKSVKGVEEK